VAWYRFKHNECRHLGRSSSAAASGEEPGSAASQRLLFWIPVTLLAVVTHRAMMIQFGGLPSLLREDSNDLRIYRDAGEALLRGELPYRDFFIEYPPGSLPFFVPPALFTDTKLDYIALFAWEMATALTAALVLTALAARKLGGTWAWVAPGLTFAIAAILLYPVALVRHDAVVTLSLATAVSCAAVGGRYLLLGYASLGLGAAAKLIPALALLPLAVARRGAGRGFAVFSAALALFVVPPLLLAGGKFLDSFAYHARRGLQVESLAASILMKLGWREETTFGHGAFEIEGRGVELAISLSMPLTAALLLLTAPAMRREYRSGRLGVGDFPRHAAALLLAFMLGSKVLSPQYMLWLLPLVPLAAGGLAGACVSAIFLVTCWATTQVFPVHYSELLDGRYPGPDLLLFRNLLLVALWALLSFPRRETGRGEPGRRRIDSERAGAESERLATGSQRAHVG